MSSLPSSRHVPARHTHRSRLHEHLLHLALAASLLLPELAWAQPGRWSLGFYGGQYYDTEPAGVIKGKGTFVNQYLLALTASRVLWQHEGWPLSLEIDGVIGQQAGLAQVTEVAAAPALRWTGFPWNTRLPTALRVAPLGISHTSVVSPLERGVDGNGARTLNFLLVELAFASASAPRHEFFVRLHHRCTIYDLLNNYGANGEDFLTLGYRRYF